MDIRCAVPTNTLINIYYYNSSNVWTLLSTINPAATPLDWDKYRYRIYGYAFTNNDIYYDTSFKIELVSTTNTDTPKFYQMILSTEEENA